MIHTVSIIEDDLKFALLLKKVIESNADMACIDIYQNLKSSYTALAENVPDVVLLDVQLPDGKGSEYVDTLKKICPETHFVMCTSFEDEEYIFSSLKKGASGYIIKSDSPDKIMEAIRDVINGGAPMSSAIAKKVVSHFKNETRTLQALSPKENEILALLASGLFYKEIASEMNVGIDTVKKHASSIYRKLQVSNRTEAVNKYRN
jgi:NarL family two-component system response regulator LiaR